MENFEVVVDESYNGIRIDKYLAEILPDFSRSRIQQLIEEGYVEVNDLEMDAILKMSSFFNRVLFSKFLYPQEFA